MPRSRPGTQIVVGDKILLDTGVIVALVNAADPDHGGCREVWSRLRARLYAVEGVLVEAAHLLSRVPKGADAAIGLVLDAGVTLVPPTESRLNRARTLMSKFHDTPMDLVDALLVVTAEEERIADIFTLDRRGFETYRFSGKRRFRIRP